MNLESVKEQFGKLIEECVLYPAESDLAPAGELGRQLGLARLPLEEIPEILAGSLTRLERSFPGMTLMNAVPAISRPLTEMLVAYGLSCKSLLEEKDQAQTTLGKSHDAPEGKSKERTAELSKANEDLINEIMRREVAEKALRESQLWVRSIFNSLEEAVLVVDPEWIIHDINPSAERMFGYSRDEIVGLSTEILHADREHHGKFWRKIRDASCRGEWPTFEFESKRKDGKVFPTEHSVSMLTDDRGDPLGIVFVVRDISNRKRGEKALRESEGRYRSLFEDSKDGIVLFTVDGTFVDLNRAAEDLFGYTREEIIDMKIQALFANPADWLKFQQEIDNSGAVKNRDFPLRRKDGKKMSCFVTSSVLKAQDERILGYQAIIRDVTERERLQEQLRRAQKMESLGTLAGGIAHDFNNLLTIIQGYSELFLASREEGDPGYADIKIVLSTALRGADLVRRILTFSRHVETRSRPMDLNHEAKQVQKLLARTIEKMINIELRLDDNLKRINADPAQVEQVLLNLAVNAQHAMPDGGNLTIETKNTALDEEYCMFVPGLETGEYVLLAVSDTGHGMDRGIRNRIFEPFFTTKKLGEGTGLGLAMVYGIVKNHNGHITCYSEPGEGTTFNIYLPVGEAEDQSDVATSAEMAPFGTETILLVDDEDLIRALGERLLIPAGYRVLTARNGQEALEVYRKKQSDISLVILDLIMPEMGGKPCLERILEIDPQVKVIISSGVFPNGPTKDVVKTGAKAFISKPFQANEMLKTVRRVLDEASEVAKLKEERC